jgi:GrpB-like predicted nucleotidyltransferase (UPF0157 family)
MTAIGRYELLDSRYHAFDERATTVFEIIKRIIESQLPGIEVEHTGSTSVGIGGENIIDALLVCQRDEFADILLTLETIGFQISPFQNLPEDRPLRVGSLVEQNKRWLIHLHLTQRGSEDHKNILFFRDFLRANQEAARQYAKIKRRAIAAGRIDATEYNDEKAPFVLSVLEKRNA